MAGAAPRFRFRHFAERWLFVMALEFATYNPTGYSYIDWLYAEVSGLFPVKVFVGVCLFILYVFIVSMALRTLSWSGIIWSVAFFSALTWAGYSLGVRLPTVALTVMWIQVAFATTLAGGMSLALLRQHISGQITPSEEGGHV